MLCNSRAGTFLNRRRCLQDKHSRPQHKPAAGEPPAVSWPCSRSSGVAHDPPWLYSVFCVRGEALLTMRLSRAFILTRNAVWYITMHCNPAYNEGQILGRGFVLGCHPRIA